MRLSHFGALQPCCPHCRRGGRSIALGLRLVEEEAREDVRFGLLGCDACGMDYPIIDGLPIIVPDLRRFVQDNLFYLEARNDLPPALAAVLVDAAGPGSALDQVRSHLSSYGWDHWGDADPSEIAGSEGDLRPGNVTRLLDAAIDGLPHAIGTGPVLDVGCGAGRTTVELARRTGRLTLGIDLSVPLARFARRAAVEGRVTYDKRRLGLVFDRRQFVVEACPLSDIWICDAAALPFADGHFSLLVGLNVLDCLGDPRAGLAEFGRVLSPGGQACLATPFDWSPAVTPVENWLGGHSARGPHRGLGEPVLDMILSPGQGAAGSLSRSRAPIEIGWRVRLHDRSHVHYTSHLSWSANAHEESAVVAEGADDRA